jgi:hypothetical protein
VQGWPRLGCTSRGHQRRDALALAAPPRVLPAWAVRLRRVRLADALALAAPPRALPARAVRLRRVRQADALALAAPPRVLPARAVRLRRIRLAASQRQALWGRRAALPPEWRPPRPGRAPMECWRGFALVLAALLLLRLVRAARL